MEDNDITNDDITKQTNKYMGFHSDLPKEELSKIKNLITELDNKRKEIEIEFINIISARNVLLDGYTVYECSKCTRNNKHSNI